MARALNCDATHCKTKLKAWELLMKPNDFKIIFVCSNKTRIGDVLEISQAFQNLRKGGKDLRIIHDEAHNPKDGIPAYRDIIENIIIQSNVLSYTPCTATIGTICDDDNPIWIKQNLENNARNYLRYDKTKSDDQIYSSCNNAQRFNFEDLMTSKEWRNYKCLKVPEKTFENTYTKELTKIEKMAKNRLVHYITKFHTGIWGDCNSDQWKAARRHAAVVIKKINSDHPPSKLNLIKQVKFLEIERKRTLEFCQMMKNDQEILAVNNGMNCLRMNHLLGIEYFQRDTFNLHIISTPRRKCITRYLAEIAVNMDYKPIVLAIYGNEGDKYHLMYKNNSYDDMIDKEVSEIMGTGAFNDKLDTLLQILKSGVNINRPFIIIGNYTPTGESLTFVNNKYGTVRGNIRLISTTREEDYQEGCRSNYMDTKFIEKDANWTQPEKYLIGPKQYIVNCLSYENENDARIDDLGLRNEVENGDIIISNAYQPLPESSGKIAIPVKIEVDRSDDEVKKLLVIMNQPVRTKQKKREFLDILKKCVEDEEIECNMHDKSGKFDWDTFEINDFRSYKKKENGPKKGEWKFRNYENHYKMETPFMNNKNNHVSKQCEVLTCCDTYLLKDAEDKKIERNGRNVWWMGYKYD